MFNELLLLLLLLLQIIIIIIMIIIIMDQRRTLLEHTVVCLVNIFCPTFYCWFIFEKTNEVKL